MKDAARSPNMESGLYEPCLAERADDGVLLRIAEHDAVEGGGEIENDDAPGTKYDRATADEASAAMARREYFVMVLGSSNVKYELE